MRTVDEKMEIIRCGYESIINDAIFTTAKSHLMLYLLSRQKPIITEYGIKDRNEYKKYPLSEY